MKRRWIFPIGLPVLAGIAALAAVIGAGSAESTSTRAPADNHQQFEDSGQLLGAATSYDVALGDVDGDGDVDAFVANGNAPHTLWINQGGAQGGSQGTFKDSGQSLGSGNGQSVKLGDLDGDGDLDAFIVTDSFPDANQVFINQGQASGNFQAGEQQFGYASGTAVALGNLNGDAYLDAYITHRLGQADRIWHGTGTGTFVDSLQALESAQSFGVDLGDLDGDGELDAFIGVYAASKVWLNQGGGNFVDSEQVLASGRTESVAVADVDGDLDLDAYVATNGPVDKLWINQGGAQGGTPGVFQDSNQALSGGATSNDVALGDVDADGDIDAIVAKSGGSDNELWINQGGAQGGQQGVFLDSGERLGSGFSKAVAMADLNGDGSLDVFVAKTDGPNKVWLNNSGPAADLLIEMGDDRIFDEECCLANTMFGIAPPIFPVTVTNLGPSPATNVTVKIDGRFYNNSLEQTCSWAGSCDVAQLGTLQKDQSAALQVQLHGTFRVSGDYFDDTMWSSAGFESRVSASENDPRQVNNSSSSFVYLADCDRGTCYLEELYCDTNTAANGVTHARRLLNRIAALADFVPNLITYYRLRDEVMAVAPDGRRYIDLYYAHNAEIQTILFADEALQSDALNVLEIWEPSLEALVKGQGSSVTITAGQVEVIDDFLTGLSAAASPELQQVIADERAKLPAAEAFAGLTMEEARGIVIGHAAYTPTIKSRE